MKVRLLLSRMSMTGFLSTIRRIFQKAMEDDILGTSARVAYYFFLSIFPGIIALFALTGILGGEQAFEWIMEHVRQGLPGDAAQYLGDFVEEITGQSRPGMLSLGLLGVVWAASNSFNGLTIGLNKMYNVEEDRSWWKRRLLSIGLLIVAGVVLNVGAIAILAGPELAEAVGLGELMVYWSWVMAFALITALLWMTYYILPNQEQSSWKREVLIGAVSGASLWIAASALFRIYVSNFGNYSATYGFVGGIIILLLWLYLTAVAILFGGEVAATLGERHTGAEPAAARERAAPA